MCEFFSAVPGSLRNHLNAEELARITITSMTAGGGLFGLLQAIMLHAGTVFPAPGDAALAVVILTTILDCRRRLGQGETLAPRSCPLRSRS